MPSDEKAHAAGAIQQQLSNLVSRCRREIEISREPTEIEISLEPAEEDRALAKPSARRRSSCSSSLPLAKEAPRIAEAAPAPAPGAAARAAQERAPAEAWSEEQLSAMKVAGLKGLCQERRLSGKGKKAELIARLLR